MNYKLSLALLLVLLIGSVFLADDLMAQCPMCRMSAETDLKNGGSDGKGLNAGIMYMLSFPYILFSVIGVIWYRNKRRVESFEQERELRALLEPLDA